MKLRAAILLIICGLLTLTGCDKNPLGTVESQGHPPVVSSVTLSPAGIRIDTVAPANGVYNLKLVLSAKVTDPEGYANIGTVQGDIVGPSGDHLLVVTMHDDGTTPDLVRGDGIFTARIDLPVSRTMTGRFYPFVTATSGSGFQSSAVSTSFLVFRQNSAPRLSNLVAPDTLHVQNGVAVDIPMHITAADSDGLADIKEVYFLSLDSSDPTKHFQLLDDGGGTNGASGDETAGDGVFSIIVRLVPQMNPNLPNPTKPSYRFEFHARDVAGDSSAAILHTVYITGQ